MVKLSAYYYRAVPLPRLRCRPEISRRDTFLSQNVLEQKMFHNLFMRPLWHLELRVYCVGGRTWCWLISRARRSAKKKRTKNASAVVHFDTDTSWPVSATPRMYARCKSIVTTVYMQIFFLLKLADVTLGAIAYAGAASEAVQQIEWTVEITELDLGSPLVGKVTHWKR